MNLKKSNQNSTLEIEFIRKGESSSDLEFSDNGGIQSDQLSDGNSTGSYPDNVSGNSEMEKLEEEYICGILKNYPWYHGMMFGSIVDKLLKWEHAYLVRRAIRKTLKNFLCISIKIDGRINHYQLDLNEEGWGCMKLLAKFPKIPHKRYPQIHQLLDAWSLVVNCNIPVPRNRLVLPHRCITLENQLGRGAFGEVYNGKYLARGATEPIEVAVKRAIGDAKRSQIQEFCHEAQIMGSLQHLNVVFLYGIASLEQPIMLVMELITGGDLKKYLQRTPNVSNKQLIVFAKDIAYGMRHLVVKKVIHRDLAARNCLITKSLQVKISDFGLSLQGQEVIVKKLKKAPIRWLAPETLSKGIFNEKTDVWSYGVVLTELMTRCATDPLYPRGLKEVQKWIKEADYPHRIENGEPKELAELVDECCEKDPAIRQNFQTVKRRLKSILEQYNLQSPRSGPLDIRKSEKRKCNTERRSSNTALTRKRSKDGRMKDRSTERRTGTQRRLTSFRRKEKAPLKLPSGMSTNQERPSPPTIPSVVPSPTTPPLQKPQQQQ